MSARAIHAQAKKFFSALKGLMLLGGTILIWLLAIHFYRDTKEVVIGGEPLSFADRATILFGAASVALFVFSILIGALAFIGWQAVKDRIRESVEAATKQRLSHLENEMRGRVYSGLGYMIGEMCVDPVSLEAKDKGRLARALPLLQEGYDLLQEVGGAAEYMGLNNLVFYSCVYGDETQREYWLKSARRLRDSGEEHNSPDLLLTYCKAILRFGLDNVGDVQRARALAASLAQAPSVSPQQREEARIYLISFPPESVMPR